MTCDQRRDLLLLYVSDALEADEAEELRQHLAAGCPECAGHLAEAQTVIASIPLGLDAIKPPADLKAKLMKRIDAASTPMRSTKEQGPAHESFGDSLPIRLFRYLVPTAVAAGFAIMLTHYVMNQKLELARQDLRAAQSANTDRAMLKFELDQTKKDLRYKTQIVDMLQSSDSKLVHLTHTDLQPNAVANLLWDQKHQQWAIVTSGMKATAKGETYELWFVTDKGAFAAGEFDVDENGNGSLAVNIPPNIGQLQKAAVTNEIAGGVKVPAGHYQVLGSVE